MGMWCRPGDTTSPFTAGFDGEDVGACCHPAGVTDRREFDAATLRRALAGQYGVISRDQALASGLTKSTLRHRIRAGGPWQRILPGMYLATTGSATADQRDMAALLYGGPGSVITAAAALRRLGLPGPSTRVVDVLVPAARNREDIDFVRIQRTTRLPAAYLSGCVSFAGPARAVADAARGLPALPAVRAIVASAVQRNRCTVEQLVDELTNGSVRGSALLRLAQPRSLRESDPLPRQISVPC